MHGGHEVSEGVIPLLFLLIDGKWVLVTEKDYKTFCECWHKPE